MNLKTISYQESLKILPANGKMIIAQQTNESLVVYQAYNHPIADYAIAHQKFGGTHYSYDRMSWIKPGFLWMMYRSGWAYKEGQTRILAITLLKSDFEKILSQAVLSTYKPKIHSSEQAWKEEMQLKDVRLQWDPDNDPFGNKIERRAIQLGIKREMLEQFGKHFIQSIEDVTEFVKEQKRVLDTKGIAELQIPEEQLLEVTDPVVRQNIGLDDIAVADSTTF